MTEPNDLAGMTPSERVRALCARSNVTRRSDLDESLRLALLALDEARELAPEDDVLLGSSHWHAAASYFALNRFEDAHQHAAHAQSFYDRAQDAHGLAKTASLEGAIARRRGYFEAAYEAQSRAVRLSEPLEDRGLLAGALNNLGLVARHLGRVDEALEAYLRAELIYQELVEERGKEAYFVYLLNNIGLLYDDMRYVDDAVVYFERAVSTAEKFGEMSMAINALHNLGLALEQKGDTEGALQAFERSVRVGEAMGGATTSASTLHSMSLVHEKRGEHQEALDKARAAVQLSSDLGAETDRLMHLRELGALTSRLGFREEGAALLGEALEQAATLDARDSEMLVRHELVLHHERLGELQEALDQHRVLMGLELAVRDAKRIEQTEELRARYGAEQRERESRLLRRHNEELSDQVAARTEELEHANALLDAARRRAEAANAAKNAFFAMMGHELRTPLNIIIGYTEMVREDLVELEEDRGVARVSPLLSDLERVSSASARLTELIDRTLTLSNLAASGKDVSPDHVDPSALVRTCVERAASLGHTAHNTVTFEDEFAPDRRAFTDEAKLTQALDALLDNANKFTHRGVISVTGQSFEHDGAHWMRLIVRDNGAGIDRDAARRVFEPFEQEEVTSVRVEEGVGLGLALVRHHIELLGGRVSVESEKGVGSSFELELPYELVPPDTQS